MLPLKVITATTTGIPLLGEFPFFSEGQDELLPFHVVLVHTGVDGSNAPTTDNAYLGYTTDDPTLVPELLDPSMGQTAPRILGPFVKMTMRKVRLFATANTVKVAVRIVPLGYK